MARTYRRKNEKPAWWITEELVEVHGTHRYEWVPIDPQSALYKKNLAKHHSDAGSHNFKEPGPSFFRRETTQAPYRRRARDLIQQYLNGTIEDVVLESMPYLEYWT